MYLVNEPITKQWIEKYSKLSESLESIYFSENDRQVAYDKIKDKILSELISHDFVTVVLYGHPTFFADPGLQAIVKARNLSIETVILPGISAENCLYADLAIDPGLYGCFHIEATELLLYDKIIDPTAHLCIWQPGVIGNRSTPKQNQKGKHLNLLKNKLLEYYPASHAATLYEASLYPGIESLIYTFLLEHIEEQNISTLSMLYIPPINQREANKQILKQLRSVDTD